MECPNLVIVRTIRDICYLLSRTFVSFMPRGADHEYTFLGIIRGSRVEEVRLSISENPMGLVSRLIYTIEQPLLRYGCLLKHLRPSPADIVIQEYGRGGASYQSYHLTVPSGDYASSVRVAWNSLPIELGSLVVGHRLCVIDLTDIEVWSASLVTHM